MKKNLPFCYNIMNQWVWLGWNEGAARNQFWKIFFWALKHHSIEKKWFWWHLGNFFRCFEWKYCAMSEKVFSMSVIYLHFSHCEFILFFCLLIDWVRFKTRLAKGPLLELADWTGFLTKLDGVGPIDNRPSTKKLHHFVRKNK